jgi:TonB family protein
MATCPHCRAQVSTTDAYCMSCGARTTAAPPPASAGGSVAGASESAASAAGSAARSSAGLKLLLVVLVNLCLLGGSAYLVYSVLLRYAQRHGSVQPGVPRLVGVAVIPQPRPAADATLAPQLQVPRRPSLPIGKKGRAGPSPLASAPTDGAVGGGFGLPAARGPESGLPAAASAAVDAARGGPKRAGAGAAAAPSGEDSAEQVRATLDADSVRMVVSHHMPQIRACYDRALKQQDKIGGQVEIQFEVKANGRVGSSSVHRNTTGHVGLGNCIAYAIKGWRFPRPVGGDVTFVYPFVFSSGE